MMSFTDQNGLKGGHMKLTFDYFQIQKWMLLTVRAEKVDEKNEVICLVSIFPSWFMVLKLCVVLQFCADLSKKSKSVRAICIYASESSHYILSKNGMVYRCLRHRLWDTSD